MPTSYVPPTGRVDWVDYAKGFCIIMVVMMHSTLGVETQAGREGFMHYFVAFAKPFRMPDFFMISGLFLSRVIDRDWRTYLDRKVVHFVYFYLLWTAIQFAIKAPHFAAEMGWLGVLKEYALSFIDPFGILWFIYLLAVFAALTKALRGIPPVLIWLVGAALEITYAMRHTGDVMTGWTLIDEFASRFVYFYTGYLFSRQVFALAAFVQARPAIATLGLAVWALFEGFMVFAGYSELPVVSLGLGLLGACAVVSVAALLAKVSLFDPLRFCGRNSIVIYLAFFLPMAATRTLLLRTDVIHDIGVISLIVTTAGVFGALAIWWAALRMHLNFLFARPARFWIAPQPMALRAAE
ncbi:MAG TPA: acyltransferase family protein [Xanthobacteraceae bacterium]|jgi:uncharacterized membrane protein YcfT